MSKRESKLYIEDIENSIEKIEEYIKTLDFDSFSKNSMVIDAVLRNLTVIGEAIKNIPEEVKIKNPEVAWSEIVSMRNKITHEYFGIDEDILWKTVKDDLPSLKGQISKLNN